MGNKILGMSSEQEWFYQDSIGQQIGPVSADQLRQLVQSGQVEIAGVIATKRLSTLAGARKLEAG